MKICLLEAELFHADGRTDRRDEANSSFLQFYEKRLNTLNVMKNRQTPFIYSVRIVVACTEQTCRHSTYG